MSLLASFFARHGELDLLFDESRAVFRVGFNRFFEGSEPLDRVVEIGDGLVEPGSRYVGEEVLELAERPGRLEGLRRSLDDVVSAGPLDEDIHSPVVPVGVLVQDLAVEGLHDFEGAARRRPPPSQFQPLMGGDAVDVVHERGRVFEDVMVDPLENVAYIGSALVVGHGESVVDVSGAIRCAFDEVADDSELLSYAF